MKILIIQPGGIGNAVMFSPVFHSMTEYFKTAEFYLLTSRQNAELFYIPSGRIKKVFRYDHKKKISFLSVFLEILFFYRFNICISSMGINPYLSSIIAFFSKANIRIGETGFFLTHKSQADTKKHEVERNINILKSFFPDKYIEKKPVFFYDKKDIERANKITEKFSLEKYSFLVGIHLGSSDDMAAKRWELNKFSELIKKIYADYKDSKAILFGGRNEKAYSEKLSLSGEVINLVGMTELSTAGLIMKKCKVFISNDSGLMHMASAAGVPVVAVFGPTIISKNRPYSDNSEIINLNLECSPCYKYNKKIVCPRNFECIKKITVDMVYDKVKKILEK